MTSEYAGQDAAQIQAEMQEIAAKLQKLRVELAKIIVGQEEVIENVILAVLAGGHVLLEGVPGLGKTSLVRALAAAVDLDFSRVQFTPDLMPSDIIGAQILVDDAKGGRAFVFQKGPVFTNILLADEINRATPKTQSALLEAMQERTVTVGRQTYPLAAPFFVMATQNPLEMEGTYPLPEAQLDRFLFKLNVPFPTPAQLHAIALRTVATVPPQVERVLNGEEMLKIQEFAMHLPIAHHVVDCAVQLVSGSQGNFKAAKQYLRGGASPRAVQALVLGSKLRAMTMGRANASVDDIQALSKPVMRHRLLLNFDAEADGIKTDQVIELMYAEWLQTAKR